MEFGIFDDTRIFYDVGQVLTILLYTYIMFNTSSNLGLYGTANRVVICVGESSFSSMLSSLSARDTPFWMCCYAVPEYD